MNDEDQYMQVFLDLLPNQPKNDQSRENFRGILREKLEARLEDSIERMWALPPIVLEQKGIYVDLLLEARELFVSGFFYSCVAMCGIVGERIVKDALRTHLLIRSNDVSTKPSEKALDQFERVEIRAIISFLKEAEILGDDSAKAARDLGELRNDYAHARGHDSKSDGLKAIQLLHRIIEDTVSVFKNLEIKDGVFVARAKPTAKRTENSSDVK